MTHIPQITFFQPRGQDNYIVTVAFEDHIKTFVLPSDATEEQIQKKISLIKESENTLSQVLKKSVDKALSPLRAQENYSAKELNEPCTSEDQKQIDDLCRSLQIPSISLENMDKGFFVCLQYSLLDATVKADA